MKKVLLFLILIIPFNIFAQETDEEVEVLTKMTDIYLEDLKVIDYEISPMFDKYNNIYTLIIDENITRIDLEYIKETIDDKVTVSGNKSLSVGKNVVTLKVEDKENTKENIYEIIVTIEDTESALLDINNYQELNINKKEPGIKEISIICGSCFLVILITFCLLFVRRKKKTKFKR